MTGSLHAAPRFARYVAIGDSSTEGLIDPDGRGGYVGWSRRLARRIALAQGGLDYANLGVRGLTTRQVLETQLTPALALKPDLATVFTGTNDVLAKDFDPDAFARDARAIQGALADAGATVLTFTLPDLTPLMPLAHRIAPRIRALNGRLRDVAAATGTRLVDFAAHPVATDRRFWNPDRIHANARGHARIAEALAYALDLPGSDARWSEPPAEPDDDGAPARIAREIWWHARYLLPWLVVRALPAPAARPRTAPARLVRVDAAHGV